MRRRARSAFTVATATFSGVVENGAAFNPAEPDDAHQIREGRQQVGGRLGGQVAVFPADHPVGPAGRGVGAGREGLVGQRDQLEAGPGGGGVLEAAVGPEVVERGAAVIRPKKGKPTIGELTVRRLKQGPKMIMSSKELMALLRDEPDEIDAD